jgi:imidazoleglycerol-phosphate dehydratase
VESTKARVAGDQELNPKQKRARVESENMSDCSSLFCCPLDEAFTEAHLDLSPIAKTEVGICKTSLAPYGKMPKEGRRWIGCYRCELTPVFWASLVSELGASLSLRKVRGDNAHHIIESTFKAFARVFRACLDSLAHGGSHGCVGVSEDRLNDRALRVAVAAGDAPSAVPAGAKARTASKSRSTKETSITVSVDLDAPAAKRKTGDAAAAVDTAGISTGVLLMDLILAEFRSACGFNFEVSCSGDVYIDDHHTAEDVSITLGQCLFQALGDKAGLARMGCAEGKSGGTTVRVVVDLSNRPHFESDLPFDEEYVGGDQAAVSALGLDASGEGVGATPSSLQHQCGRVLSCEMLFHVFDSLTIETRATAHVELRSEDQPGRAGHTLDLAVAMARAYGSALAECVRVDPRRAGAVASSKGTLSV